MHIYLDGTKLAYPSKSAYATRLKIDNNDTQTPPGRPTLVRSGGESNLLYDRPLFYPDLAALGESTMDLHKYNSSIIVEGTPLPRSDDAYHV